MTYKYRASLKILHYAVGFETDCAPAFRYLRRLPSFFQYKDYQFIPTDAELRPPLVRYHHSPSYSVDYRPESRTIVVHAPYQDFPLSNSADYSMNSVLLVPIWRAAELIRQSIPEYFFHASAVERNDRAVILCGQAECGKTILALDLCMNHGFSLYSNDETLIRLRDQTYELIMGDARFRFRYSSLRQYDDALMQTVFGPLRDVSRPWELKKAVDPASLGISTRSGAIALTYFFLIKLDQSTDSLHVAAIDPASPEILFNTKLQLHWDLADRIRGGYAPLDRRLNSMPFFIPSFDTPAFLLHRNKFIDMLFEQRKIIAIRGPLQKLSAYISELMSS
jgi:hypothetical protein